jgi:SAM-dependent methyltransferase
LSWRKYLLVPRLAKAGLGPTPDPDAAWDTYWRAADRTGPDGDVLWDGAGEQEMRWWLDTADEHLHPGLPVLDAGCGNGRLSRLLASEFRSVLGVDVSEAALRLATRESRDWPNVTFRPLDITAEGAGVAIRGELGMANVVVRGVFHVLDQVHRRRAAANLAHVLGSRGSLLLLETNYPGDLLEYMEYLGARPAHLPDPLARLVDLKTPRPSSFGPVQLAETFPAPAWMTVVSGPTDITPARSLGSTAARTIPGFYAVLRAGCQPIDPSGRPGPMSEKRSGDVS